MGMLHKYLAHASDTPVMSHLMQCTCCFLMLIFDHGSAVHTHFYIRTDHVKPSPSVVHGVRRTAFMQWCGSGLYLLMSSCWSEVASCLMTSRAM